MAANEKGCIFCQAPLVGRADKKFCSNQCRALFANYRRMHDPGELLIKNINSLLRQNRDLLRKASPVGKTTLRRSILELSGFNFNYYTHLYRTRQGNVYHFCYDYGYLEVADDKILIVNWQPYMDKGQE